MNEKMLALVERAWDPSTAQFHHIGDTMSTTNSRLVQDMMPIFERLIREAVGECCAMINAHIQHNNPHDCVLVLNIKEHFGIDQ